MRPSILTLGAALLALLVAGCGSAKPSTTQPTPSATAWPPPTTAWPPPATAWPPPAAQPAPPTTQPTPPATTPSPAAPARVSFCGMDLAVDLRELQCHDQALTDLSPLKALTQLERLNLSDTKVNDIRPLAGLAQLRTLDLSRTNVTDLGPLRGLSRLDTLVLATVPVDKLAKEDLDPRDSLDLRPLASLPALRELDLAYSLVIDLSPLRNIKTLVWVRVTGTHTDTYNVKKVRAALPGCDVVF